MRGYARDRLTGAGSPLWPGAQLRRARLVAGSRAASLERDASSKCAIQSAAVSFAAVSMRTAASSSWVQLVRSPRSAKERTRMECTRATSRWAPGVSRVWSSSTVAIRRALSAWSPRGWRQESSGPRCTGDPQGLPLRVPMLWRGRAGSTAAACRCHAPSDPPWIGRARGAPRACLG
jgi:hypothetical protein